VNQYIVPKPRAIMRKTDAELSFTCDNSAFRIALRTVIIFSPYSSVFNGSEPEAWLPLYRHGFLWYSTVVTCISHGGQRDPTPPFSFSLTRFYHLFRVKPRNLNSRVGAAAKLGLFFSLFKKDLYDGESRGSAREPSTASLFAHVDVAVKKKCQTEVRPWIVVDSEIE